MPKWLRSNCLNSIIQISSPSRKDATPRQLSGWRASSRQHFDRDCVLAILPADHVITDLPAFQAALRRGFDIAAQGFLVTLGIEPTFPHTGYGYIQRGAPLPTDGDDLLPAYRVERFLEKPDSTAAETFLTEGGYYWNGGIFICRVDTMLAEMKRQLPEISARLERIGEGLRAELAAPELDRLIRSVWPDMPNISIDYGVMEGAASVAVVPLRAGWSDVGSWDALESVLLQDETRNYVAKGEVLTIDSHNNIIYTDKKVVALIGVKDLVVVDAGDRLLIGRKNDMQRVKEIVERLRATGRSELL